MQRQVIQYYSKDPLKYTSYYPDIDPSKDLDEVGFYLSLASRVGDRPQDNFQSPNTFSTGISFQCPIDRTVEITGTPALVRQGYYMLHPISVDVKNNEEIKVELFKFSDKDDIIIPFHKGLKATIKPACYHHLKKTKGNTVAVEQARKEDTTTESDFF